MADKIAPPEIITAHVSGHLRNAVKYALIENPDIGAMELALALCRELAKFVREICGERDRRKA